MRWDAVSPVDSGNGQRLPPPFSLAELTEVAKRLPTGKAQGLDGVHNEVIKILADSDSEALLDILNTCLWETCFPTSWKVARFALVHKGGRKPVTEPSSYWPFCMLNNVAKLMERLVISWLSRVVATNGEIAHNQFGFCVGRGTV